MINPNAEFILDLLNKNGFESYVVGGCTRDMLLNKIPKDWDICTDATTEQILNVFSGYKIIPTGLKYGTVTIVINDENFEVTTYRADGDYLDGRRPDSVIFIKDLKEDLQRRDFTINAIAFNKEFVDYFGGTEDLRNKVIKCVGNPINRFTEDKLRILRALRFASVFGFEIEDNTLEAMLELSKEVRDTISAERIQTELIRMVCGNYFSEIILKEKYANVFFNVFSEFKPMWKHNQCTKYHCFDVWEHTLQAIKYAKSEDMKLIALLHDMGKPKCFSVDENNVGHFYGHADTSTDMAREFLNNLRFSRKTQEHICNVIFYHQYFWLVNRKSITKAIKAIGGKELFLDICEFRKIDILAQSDVEKEERLLKIKETRTLISELENNKESFAYSLKMLDINGNDLIKAGYKFGPEIGKCLNFLLEFAMNGEVENQKDKLINYLKNYNLTSTL